MRRFFSFLWRGGSDSGDEGRPTYRNYATGRSDLPNARPWMQSSPGSSN